MTTGFAEQVSAVSPLDGDAIDGSERPKPRRAPIRRISGSFEIEGTLYCVGCNATVSDDLEGVRHVNRCLWQALVIVAGSADGAKELAQDLRSPSIDGLPGMMSSFVTWRASLDDEECRAAAAVRARLRSNGYEVPDEITQKAREYDRRLFHGQIRLLTPAERRQSRCDAVVLARRIRLENSALRAQSIPLPAELLAMRESSGLSATEVARKLGVSHTSLRHWERGAFPPSRKNLDAYVALLRRINGMLVPVARRRELRVGQGLRQIDIARAVGVTDRAIGAWEHGKCNPDTEDRICRYAEALGWQPGQQEG